MLRRIISGLVFALPLSCWGWGPGYYVGGGLGADTIDFYNISYIKQSPSSGAGTFSAYNTTNQGAEGLFATAFGGYGWVREAFYLASEINVNGSSAAFKTINQEHDHPSMTKSYSRYTIIPTWGISFLPGWILWEDTTIIYGRVGYAGGVFTIHTSDTSFANFNSVINGIRYGLGIDKKIYKNFSFRLEYNHILYQGKTINHLDTSNGAVTFKQNYITPQTNQFEFGVVYRFC